MTDENIKIYEYWREASQRFDYFVTGLIGALVAFIGQSFAPQRIGLNTGTVELLALLILVLSFLAAFKRIESSTEAFRLMSQRNRADDKLIDLRNIVQSGQIAQEVTTGAPITPEAATKMMDGYQSESNTADKYLKKFSKRAKNYYHMRNYLLISGFLLLIVARVLKVYLCAP